MNTSASEAGFDNERAYALHDPRGVVGVTVRSFRAGTTNVNCKSKSFLF